MPPLNEQEPTTTMVFFNYHPLTWLVGLVVLSIVVTFFVMIYWYSKQKRGQYPKSVAATSLEKIDKTKDLPLYSLVSERVQPVSHNQISSYPNINTKNTRKNLLERRGTNNSLKLSITTKHRPLSSPPSDHASDEYLQTATRKLTLEELHQYAKDPYRLSHEFWSIPSNHLEKLRICGAGTKNRYGTIIANEHSRVLLPEVSGDPVSSYINANYIRGWPNQSRAYIATQGPLANTIIDFYRMIWQENVPVIVMITRLVERNQSKCERYIPSDQMDIYGSFHVQIQSTIYEKDYELRRLIIEFNGEQRQIDHFWYTAWPDHSCPDVAQPLIDLVHHLEASRDELIEINQNKGPIVVHCSAGIGRTGCFIALSNGIKQIDQEQAVDIVRILCQLRQDRGGMIQTNDQYQFVYQALSEYAHNRSLSFPPS